MEKDYNEVTGKITGTISELSHMVDTPLNMIYDFTGLALEDKNDLLSRKNLLYIQLETRRLKKIFDNFFEYLNFENENILEEEPAKIGNSEARNKLRCFISNLNHEINSSLNVLCGFTEIIIDKNDTESQRKCLLYIQSGAKRLITLFENICG